MSTAHSPLPELAGARPVRTTATAANPDEARPTRAARRAARRPRRKASRGTFIALNGAVLIAGLLSLLMINTSLAQGAFELSGLQRELQGLQEEQTTLAESIAKRSSPIALAAAAERLGMVRIRRAAFLRIDDGRIIGRARPVPYPGLPEPKRRATE